VGQAVRLGPLDRVPLGELQAISPAFEADVAELWDFQAAVNRRSVIGGTAASAVHDQLREARSRLAL